jgi:hypothetical protein
MPAHYQTFQDTPVNVVPTPAIAFTTPNVDTAKRAHLSLSAIPDLTAGPTVDLEADINGTFIFQVQFSSGDTSVVQANIDPGVLDPNGNTLTLIKAAGLGEVAVSNCIVHFKS